MPALLEIEEYSVDRFLLEVNSQFKGGDSYEAAMGVDFNIGRATGGEPRFEVKLFIDLNKSEDNFNKSPYRISLVITGYFHFIDDTDEDTIGKMIGPNGLSILYGIARGTVAQLTGCSRYGKLVLPSFNFIELLKEKAKKEKENKKLKDEINR